MLLWALALVLSIFVLVRAAGGFIRSAETVGLHLGLSPFVLGVSVVAIGTSFPELVSGIAAVLEGASEIAVGTVVGSNVTNILLVLGLSALLGGGMKVDHELVRVDLPFLFGSALGLWMVASDGEVTTLEGLFGIALIGAYTVYAASTPEAHGSTVAVAASEAGRAVSGPSSARPEPGREPAGVAAARPRGEAARTLADIPLSVWGRLVVSILLTQLGAYFTVAAAVELAQRVGVGNEVIAATVIAVGTSLPELVVSARAASQGSPEVAVGNVIGSNIFNALGVVGFSALFGSLAVPASLNAFALPAMVGVTVLAFFVLQEREMTRWDGWLLIALYALFLSRVSGLG